MKKVTLVCFPLRGHAEPARLLLELGGWDWHEHHPETHEEFRALASETTLGDVPWLKIQSGDGSIEIVEHTAALQNYLARAAGLLPAREPDRYRIEMLAGILRDLAAAVVRVPVRPDRRSALRRLREGQGARCLPVLDRALREWGDGEHHLVGDRLTLADVLAFDALTGYQEWHPGHLEESYPALVAHADRLATLPALAPYLGSERRRGPSDRETMEAAARIISGVS